MLNHDVKRIGPCLFTQLGPNCDVASNNSLKRRPEGSKDISRADDDTSDNAKILHHTVVWQLKRSSHHVMRNRVTWWTNGIRDSLLQGIGAHRFPPRPEDFRLNRLVLVGFEWRWSLSSGIQRKDFKSHRLFLS